MDARVETRTNVTSLVRDDSGYIVTTDQGEWRSRAVVLAAGACNIAGVPPCAAAVPAQIHTLTPMQYRNPDQLPSGGVLVVGASATGIQLAHEIHRSGRPVTLCVGDDIARARGVPSMQLVGSPERMTLDLNTLSDIGVKLVGRLAGIRDGKAQFSGALRNQCALSDLKMNRLLDTIDQWAAHNGLDGEIEALSRLVPTHVEDSPPLGLDLASGEIKTILWATGYRPDYSWLHVPVLDRKGHVRHDGGITPSPGLYLMGMQFLRRRKSALIDGAGDDARDLSAHLAAYLTHPVN